MDSNGYSVLSDPHSCRHIVYPYNDEKKAVNAVYIFVRSGLFKGESVVLIMADSHSGAIKARLAEAGFDVDDLGASGQLECISADSMLRELMPDGKPSEALFRETIGRVIGRARANSSSHQVRIFGEMVSLLLAQGEIAAAEKLEVLWNEAIDVHKVSVFCTYRLLESGFKTLPHSLSNLHSHDISQSEGRFEPIEMGASVND